MLTKLALKELRETAWIAAAALAVYLYFAVSLIGLSIGPWTAVGRGTWIPFVVGELLEPFAVVAICLAAGLGFRQTVGESARGTFLFLLHRPAARERLIGAKLAVGGGLYLVCSAVPIAIYAWWAATPGTHASPFEWSMTFPIWKVWITMLILYLGAFLSGLRPARWYGTRLFPLAATGGVVLALSLLPWWGVVGLAVVLLLVVLLVAQILFVARTRDFS